MAENFKNLAKYVTNSINFEGLNFYSFDNGEFAYEWREHSLSGREIICLRCCNGRGRDFSNTGRFAEIVSAQHRAIERSKK